MTGISSLFVQLSLQADNFNNGMRDAQLQAKEFQKTVAPTKKLLDDIGGAMTSAGQSLTVGVTLPLVAFGVMAVKNFNDAAHASALMENAIRSTGGAAGKSADELRKLATSLQGDSVFDDDEIIQKTITQLLTFTNVAGSSFDRGAQAALNMSTVLGQDLQSSTIAVGKALNDPIAGVTALQRLGVKLSEDQKKLVKSFMDVNDVAGAQNVILNELEKQYGGAAKAASEVGSGPMTKLWVQIGNLSEKFGELIQKALSPFIGYAEKAVEWLDGLSDSTKLVALAVGGFAAAMGPLLLVSGKLAKSVSSMIDLYGTLSKTLPKAVEWIAAQTGVTSLSTGATWLWNAALTALPFVAIAIAAVAAIKVFYDLYQTIQNNREAAESLAAANKKSDEGLVTNIANLKKLGIEYDATGKTIQQAETDVSLLMQAYYKLHPAVKAAAEVHVVSKEATDAAAAALKIFRSGVENVKQSVMGNAEETRKLVTGVEELLQKHTSATVIAKVFGDRFVEIYNTLKNTGQEIPNTVRQFNAIAVAMKVIHDQGPLRLIPADLDAQTQQFLLNLKTISLERLTALQSIGAMEGAEMKIRVAEMDAYFAMLASEGRIDQHLAEVRREAYGIDAGFLAEVLGLRKEDIELMRQQAGAEAIRAAAAAKAAESYQHVWEAAMGNVVSGIVNGFSDVIFHAKSFGDAMKGIATQTADAMFKAFLTGLLSPMTSAMSKLGTGLANMLMGAKSGSSGGGFLSVIGGLFGKGKGGGGGPADILMPDGSSLPGLPGASSVFGGGGAGGGMLGSVGGIGGALGIAGLGLTFGTMAAKAWKDSQAHWEADDWVQNHQNPFDAYMAGAASADEKWKAMQDYVLALNQFEKQGSDEMKVGQQAYASYQASYGNIRDPQEARDNAASFGTPKGNALLEKLMDVMQRYLQNPPLGITVNGAFGTPTDIARIIGQELQRLTRDEGFILQGAR